MSKGRPRVELVVSEADRDQLMSMSRSRSLPASLVLRAKIVLGCMQQPNSEVARALNTHPATVGKWRRRFIEAGLAGLHDEARPGKPRSINDEQLAELINKTLQSKPEGGTHWSVRDLAKQTQISKSSVHRLLKLFSLQPHRQETFKLSTESVLH
ncbi:MAG: transposase [Proteobacteria bacterium]|nr:transposase [Pseudomonadota bacterium]